VRLASPVVVDEGDYSSAYSLIFDDKYNSVRKLMSDVWTQVGQDIGGEEERDMSGWSVSLSSDGKIVAIGATTNDGNGMNSGHVRVFKLNDSTSIWEQVGEDIDGKEASDKFGSAVSLSSDGKVVAIGANSNNGNGDNSGHVRVFYDVSGTWKQIGQDIDGEDENNWSGDSVSLSSDGTVVAIGASRNDGNGDKSGHVRVWRHNGVIDNWEQIGEDIDGEEAGDMFGCSVSLSSDGKTVAVGAHSNEGNRYLSGHVRVFQLNDMNSSWEQVGQDIDGEEPHDMSGNAISLSMDGKTLAIAANQNDGNGNESGHVRVFQLDDSSSTWEQVGQDIDGENAGDEFGKSVSLSSDGNTVAVGSTVNGGNGDRSGHVRVFQLDFGTDSWVQVDQDIDGEEERDMSGFSVSLSSDGKTVAIGAPMNGGNGVRSGHVRVFQLQSSASPDLQSSASPTIQSSWVSPSPSPSPSPMETQQIDSSTMLPPSSQALSEKTLIIIAVAAGGVVGVAVFAVFVVCLCCFSQKKKGRERENTSSRPSSSNTSANSGVLT